MTRFLRPLVLGMLLLVIPALSLAAPPQTGPLGATAAVANSCLIKSADNLTFGAYSPISGLANQAAGQVQLTCTKAAAVTVGRTGGGSGMTGPGGALAYGLYMDAGLTKPWGSGSTVTTATINFANTTIFFTTQTTQATVDACAALANGTLFSYFARGSRCYTGYSQTNTAFHENGTNAGGGLIVYGGATIKAPSGDNVSTEYLPASSTPGTGFTYTVPTSIIGTGDTFTGTSSSAQTPLAFTYFGNVPANQDLPAGAYMDTVTFQISF